MLRGEVWQAALPSGGGHAQAASRPAILIQNDSATALLPTVLVIPVTGQLAAQRYPGTLLVQPDAANGLRMPSVALVFQARALDKRDLVQRLGAVDDVTLGQLLAILLSLVS